MDEVSNIVIETASRLFADAVTPDVRRAADAGGWPQSLWQAVEDAGLLAAMIPEDVGGLGVEPEAAAELVRLCGYYGLPVPLPETMLATRLLAEAGLAAPAGPIAFAGAGRDDALSLVGEGSDRRIAGRAHRVAWGGRAGALAVLCSSRDGQHLVLLGRDDYAVEPGSNIAGEPRDTVLISTQLVSGRMAQTKLQPSDLWQMGACLRSLAMSGALERVLDITVRYAGERSQFGKPIGRFQAVQQNLAILAGQVAAANGAAALAGDTLAGGSGAEAAAAAKIRAGEAAGIGAAIAHQVHGAIGFSQEHELHLFTRRLWSWRDEFGGEAEWSRFLGERALKKGADVLWPFIAAA
ncbi:acyl-CoA dehydrogenase family protein [Bosea sp. RCC_152_1]|uniref:acyl-CoA dehydrogenase family protein n=1 Tax=Bosea sp. RCC_152_1 TaxID=3239228 RepID=UPI00352508D3